jgi:hypothetical protein
VAALVLALLVAAVLVVLARVGLWKQPLVSDRAIRFFAWALAGVFVLETLASFTWGRMRLRRLVEPSRSPFRRSLIRAFSGACTVRVARTHRIGGRRESHAAPNLANQSLRGCPSAGVTDCKSWKDCDRDARGVGSAAEEKLPVGDSLSCEPGLCFGTGVGDVEGEIA